MREKYEKELTTEIPPEVKKKVMLLCKKRNISLREYFRLLVHKDLKDLEKDCETISSEAIISKKMYKKRRVKTRLSNRVKNEVILLCKKRNISLREYFRLLIYKDLEKDCETISSEAIISKDEEA